jgi:hypothetical protein
VFKTVILVAISVPLSIQTTSAQAAYDVLSGSAYLQRQNQTFSAVRGVKLIEGDTLVVPSQIQFLGDFGAFVATAKPGFYQMTLLRRETGCIRNLISYRGKINITPRPLRCDRSLLQIISLLSGGSYTFRGTNAWLEDEGQSTKLAVEHGLVETSAQGITVPVPGGYGNITKEGQPPGPAIALDSDLSLRDLKIARSALGVEISAKINPLNSIRIQGVDLETFRGESKVHLDFPIAGNSLAIEVQNSQGKRRIYSLPLPSRK